MKNIKIKPYLGKAIKTLSVLSLSATLLAGFAGCKNGNETLSLDDIKATYPLLNQEKIMAELTEQYGEEHNLYSGKDFYRLPMTIESQSTPINVNFETNQKQQEVINFCVDEINDIFGYVNKKYNFQLNYSPNQNDLKNPYAINLCLGENNNLQTPVTFELKDLSPEIDGNELYNASILIQKENLSSELALSKQIKSAFAQLLGLEEKDNSVISSNYSTSFTKNDITVLYSLYRSPENVYDLEGLKNYITDHKVFDFEKLVADKTLELLSQSKEFLSNQFAQNNDYRLNELESISKSILAGENDKEFGKDEINFVNKIKNLNCYKQYHHMSIKDGEYTQTNFLLDNKYKPTILNQNSVEVTTNNGIVVSRNDENLWLSIKVGNYVVSITSTLNSQSSLDKLLQNANATVYSVTDQDYQTYSQSLSEQCIQNYSLSQ